MYNLGYDHPTLVQILELCMELTRDGREIVFIWVPGQVGIREISAADSAAKDALIGDISDELTPFSDLKSCVNIVRALAMRWILWKYVRFFHI